jgi:tRNA(Ile)-lysidine synthase TilS/MesJ
VATCQANDIEWYEDPSNNCIDFSRNRIRQAVATLEHQIEDKSAPEELSLDNLSRLNKRLKSHREVMEKRGDNFHDECGT